MLWLEINLSILIDSKIGHAIGGMCAFRICDLELCGLKIEINKQINKYIINKYYNSNLIMHK